MKPFIDHLQRRTAQSAIGPSALRNQGAAGVVAGARTALENLNLTKYSYASPETFAELLDQDTSAILKCFPARAQSWGAARKGLNLFLRDATYNIDLNSAYNLSSIRCLLEVPLDRDIANALLGQPEGHSLPKWASIKGLTKSISDKYQLAALEVASRYKVNRIDLDIFFWRQ